MLNINPDRYGIGVNLWKISGLTDAELSELNSMDYRDMKDKIVEIADTRESNHRGIGTQWAMGYGIYNAYIKGKDVYVEVGSTCD